MLKLKIGQKHEKIFVFNINSVLVDLIEKEPRTRYII